MKKEKLEVREFSPKRARREAYFNLGLAAINLSYGSENRSQMFTSILFALQDDPQGILNNRDNLEKYLSKRYRYWNLDFQGLGFEYINGLASEEKYCEVRANRLEQFVLKSESFLKEAENGPDIADMFFASKGIGMDKIPSDKLTGEWQKVANTDSEVMGLSAEMEHVYGTLRATRKMVLVDATMMIATGQTIKREFGPECDPLASIFYQAWSTFLNRREYQG